MSWRGGGAATLPSGPRGGWGRRGAVAPASPPDPAARARAAAWAAALAADPRAVYLDTETTGLDATAEVVDIAVVGADGRVLLETLVRPAAPIPAAAHRVHGISDADVAAAPSWCDVHDALVALLWDRPVVVYNAAFDQRIVGQCCDRFALPRPRGGWLCAMLAFAAYRGEWNPRRGGYRWHKLEAAVETFGVPTGGHRARGDALACRAVVLGMAAEHGDGGS